MSARYQVQFCSHKVNGQWLKGWQIVTKSGRYVGTAKHLRDVDAVIRSAS